MNIPTIYIDTDRRCESCGKRGVASVTEEPGRFCLACIGKGIAAQVAKPSTPPRRRKTRKNTATKAAPPGGKRDR